MRRIRISGNAALLPALIPLLSHGKLAMIFLQKQIELYWIGLIQHDVCQAKNQRADSPLFITFFVRHPLLSPP
jgi:hypothetical protein